MKMHFGKILLKVALILKLLGSVHLYTWGRSVNLKAKKLLESSMDASADPCEDFYNYSCGKWQDFHQGSDDEYQEAITLVDYNTNKDMGRRLKYLILRQQPQFVQKLHQYFQSCLNVEEYQPLEYLKWLKQHEQLKWPTLWPPHKPGVDFDWLRTLTVMRRYGMNGIFVEQIALQKDQNVSITIIDLDKPVRNDGLQVMEYRDLKTLIQTLPEPLRSRSVDDLWEEISTFERRLKNLEYLEDSEGSTLIKVKDLSIPWLKRYLSSVLEQAEIDPNMELYIQNIPYFKAVDKLINEYEPRFICKYLELRFLWFLNVQGPPNFSQIDCVSHTRLILPYAANWLFEEVHPELVEEMSKVKELFQQLIKQFHLILSNNTNNFASDEVQFLSNKLHNIQLKVGNLPRVNTTQTLEKFYESVTLNSSDFYGNHLKLLKFTMQAVRMRLQQPLPRNADEFFYVEEPDSNFFSSSPYFIQRANIVVVPLTILQLPIYHPNLKEVYKYSLLGFLLAHEITHAFDYTGLNVDASGQMNVTQLEIISNNSRFDKSINCLRDINPTVIDEKIADVSGLRLAFETYFSIHPEMRLQTQYLNGEKLSLSKVFFLNFAQFFCGANVGSNDHGRDRDRLIDALLHFHEFADTFKCPLGSRMRPSQRTCQLWRR